MPDDYNSLSDMQGDALQELFNIGIGRAARSLSQLLFTDVAMSTPVLIMVPTNDSSALVSPALQKTEACVVTREIGGIDAEVAMIFQGSRSTMAALIPTLLREDSINRDQQADAATKMGYLVIESCIDQLESIVGHSLERRAVGYLDRVPNVLFSKSSTPERPLAVIRVDIRLTKHNIAGHLFFAFTQDAANHLAAGLDRVVADSEGR